MPWDTLRLPRDTLYPQTLALTSPTSGGHSIGTVRSRAKATECFLVQEQENYRHTDKIVIEEYLSESAATFHSGGPGSIPGQVSWDLQ
jgi:hypothetical protein